MNKQQKINYIKFWLQCFGFRDNETFNINVEIDGNYWELMLQYSYSDDGLRLEPMDWCGVFGDNETRKLIPSKSFDYRTEEELDVLIKKLKSIKQFY